MTSRRVIDRSALGELMSAEEQRFVDLHPRSAELAESGRRHLLAGVPMPWMTRWPGAFPIHVAEASGARFVDVDGIEYVDFCLGDTGAMAGPRHGRAGGARGTVDDDVAERGRRVGCRRTRSTVRDGEVAAHHVGHRRQPLRAAFRSSPHRSTEDRRDGLVLSRHGRRDARHPRARMALSSVGRARSARRWIPR